MATCIELRGHADITFHLMEVYFEASVSWGFISLAFNLMKEKKKKNSLSFINTFMYSLTYSLDIFNFYSEYRIDQLVLKVYNRWFIFNGENNQ